MKKLGALIGIVSAAFLISLAVAVPKSNVVYVELGENIPSAPSDYLFGCGITLKDAAIDVSEVDTNAIGRYQVYADFLFYHYTIDVEVRDTTAPVIALSEQPVVVAADRVYAPADLVGGIYDPSGGVHSTVTYEGNVYDSISFTETGEHTAVITATDALGNEGSREITFTVDDAPMIIGAFDRHIAVGSEFDPHNVVAADSTDGILTDRLQIDAGNFDPNTAGDYQITYTVSDNYGLQTSAAVTLHVVEKKNPGEFDDAFRLTAPEIGLLCDLAYFSYAPLEEENYDEAVRLVEPTLVDLKRVWKDGTWAAGSGAIYKITPSYIYLISVAHVTKEVGEDCRIMFFDGEVVTDALHYVTSEQKNEMAMFAVSTADIPADTLLAVRQLCVDPDIYTKINVGDKVVAYAKYWNGTDKDLIRTMEIKAMTSSIKEFDFIDSLLETTSNVTNGMSGTAVIDYKGNLVGLASAAGPSTAGGTAYSSFHSKIDVIPELSQKLEDSLT